VKRPTIQLLGYLVVLALASWGVASLLAPWLPYPFFKILRRAATVLAALTLVPFLTRIQHRRLRDLGLAVSSAFWTFLAQGIGVGTLLFGALLSALWALGVVTWHVPTAQGWLQLAAFVPAAFAIAVLEELFFRGVVLQSLVADVGAGWAVGLSSLLYAVLHFIKYLARPLSVLPELIGLALLGILLASAYLRTRSLALPIGVHMSVAYLAKVDRQFVDFVGREPRWFFGTDRWLTGVLGWGMLGLAWLAIGWLTRSTRLHGRSMS